MNSQKLNIDTVKKLNVESIQLNSEIHRFGGLCEKSAVH
jgi:hypothetical protein